MSAPVPIPTLPISSATASQAAHIASLTTQVHQLVDKNNAITARLEQAQKDAQAKLHSEIKRSDDIVREMRDAHKDEMKRMNEQMETLRISAVHAQQSIAYSHQVTKHDLKLTENALAQQKSQNIVQAAVLVRAMGREDLLLTRFTAVKSSHARQVQELKAKVDEAQAELVASQVRASEQDDKITTRIKNQLESTQASLVTAQDKISLLETSKSKIAAELAASEAAHEKLRAELKEEKKARKEVERDLREVKEQLASRDNLENRDADTAKQNKRRLRELEVALASEQGRVTELETVRAELEAERSVWRVEKRKLEKATEKAAASTTESASVKKGVEKPKEPTKKKEKQEAAQSKKRPREEDDDEGGTVIQGTSGKPVVNEEPKKRKKAKLHDSDTEGVKPKPSKVAKAAVTISKPKKAPVMTKAKHALSSSVPPSPSPVSTPQLSEEENDVSIKSKPKPAPPLNVPRVAEAGTKKKFKVPERWDNEGGGASDSDDLGAKRAKWFGGEPKKDAKKIADPKGKGKAISREDEGEVFDLDAVSDASEDEEQQEEKPKKKAVDNPKPKPKPKATSKASETTSSKPVVSKPAASKPDKKKVVEVENLAPVKPKKKTFNLLGGVTNGTSIGSFNSWGGGLNTNLYNIPSQLSSPEKGGGLVPRATFQSSK